MKLYNYSDSHDECYTGGKNPRVPRCQNLASRERCRTQGQLLIADSSRGTLLHKEVMHIFTAAFGRLRVNWSNQTRQ